MKRFILLIVFLQVVFITEAKQKVAEDGVDVIEIYANTYNGSSYRSETISADITGHTLTITFNDNVGIAHIVIKDSNGVYIDRENVFLKPQNLRISKLQK